MLNEKVPLADTEHEIEPAQEPEELENKRTMFRGREKQELNAALTRFTSCGRCSLFLAAYRLYHDDAELQAAVNNIDGGWLILPWDPSIRKLIKKSYGCRIDVDAYHFESRCPECHGPFVYSEREGDESYSLRVKM